jgi:hypothetical protein
MMQFLIGEDIISDKQYGLCMEKGYNGKSAEMYMSDWSEEIEKGDCMNRCYLYGL